jgi:hypothetical protein
VYIRSSTNLRLLTRNFYRHHLSSKVQESVKYLKADNLEVEALQIISRGKLRNSGFIVSFVHFYICAFIVWSIEKIYIAVVTLILHSETYMVSRTSGVSKALLQSKHLGKVSVWTDRSLLKSHTKITSTLPKTKVGNSPPPRTSHLIQQMCHTQGYTIEWFSFQ